MIKILFLDVSTEYHYNWSIFTCIYSPCLCHFHLCLYYSFAESERVPERSIIFKMQKNLQWTSHNPPNSQAYMLQKIDLLNSRIIVVFFPQLNLLVCVSHCEEKSNEWNVTFDISIVCIGKCKGRREKTFK